MCRILGIFIGIFVGMLFWMYFVTIPETTKTCETIAGAKMVGHSCEIPVGNDAVVYVLEFKQK